MKKGVTFVWDVTPRPWIRMKIRIFLFRRISSILCKFIPLFNLDPYPILSSLGSFELIWTQLDQAGPRASLDPVDSSLLKSVLSWTSHASEVVGVTPLEVTPLTFPWKVISFTSLSKRSEMWLSKGKLVVSLHGSGTHYFTCKWSSTQETLE